MVGTSLTSWHLFFYTESGAVGGAGAGVVILEQWLWVMWDQGCVLQRPYDKVINLHAMILHEQISFDHLFLYQTISIHVSLGFLNEVKW